MLTEDAVKYLGSKAKLAKALDVSQPAVSRWGEMIPEKRAARLSLMTDGVLVYDPKAYQLPAKTA